MKVKNGFYTKSVKKIQLIIKNDFFLSLNLMVIIFFNDRSTQCYNSCS